MPNIIEKYSNYIYNNKDISSQGFGINGRYCMLADVSCWIQDEYDSRRRVLWTTGIPYSYAPTVTTSQRAVINDAIYRWNQSVPYPKWQRADTAATRVEFTTYSMSGIDARAQLGRIGGVQNIWINPNTYSINDTTRKRYAYGIIMHEMGHTIGMLHEHQRCDRDLYVVVTDSRHAKLCGQQYQNYGPYNYSSLMHYGPWQGVNRLFGTTPSVPAVGNSSELGQRMRLDAYDLNTIQQLYTF